MTKKSTHVWGHEQYLDSIDAVNRMRISVAGEDAVKDAGETLLPHPCTCPKEAQTDEQRRRYEFYKLMAEYENVPSNTLETLTGAMFRVDPVLEAPATPYLIADADGNGLSLQESIELAASECLQMRYFGVLVEYSGLGNVDPTEISVADKAAANLRPTLKHYQREDIVDWSYRVIGGVKKLNMLVLREVTIQDEDPETITAGGATKTRTTSYLVLGIDREGHYFQRRFINDGKTDGGTTSETVYPLANGAKLTEVPFVFIFATQRKIGDIPKQLGYLDPISAKSIHRYQASALLKEALRITAQPTSFSAGWTASKFKLYKEATGFDSVKLGGNNHLALPEGVEAGYLNWDADSNALFKYREDNRKEIIALGGVFDDLGEQAETATAAAINSAEKKGVLSTLAKNIEDGYRKVYEFVAMFEGISADGFVCRLSREFVAVRLSAQERAAILMEVRENIISLDEALRQLKRGGVLADEIEAIKDELQNSTLI